MQEIIEFTLNGEPARLTTDGDRRLLWVLRTDLALTGTKCGCGKGLCGACTVLLDRKAVRSCVLPVRQVKGKEVITIEGLARDGKLHPLQKAFAELDGLQCGFCTPGMILAAYGLLQEKPEPTRDEIVQDLDRNLCRCGAHVRILEAIQSAARVMKGGVRS